MFGLGFRVQGLGFRDVRIRVGFEIVERQYRLAGFGIVFWVSRLRDLGFRLFLGFMYPEITRLRSLEITSGMACSEDMSTSILLWGSLNPNTPTPLNR